MNAVILTITRSSVTFDLLGTADIADHISLIFLALSVCLIPNVPILFAACIRSHREIPDRASTLYSELNI